MLIIHNIVFVIFKLLFKLQVVQLVVVQSILEISDAFGQTVSIACIEKSFTLRTWHTRGLWQ